MEFGLKVSKKYKYDFKKKHFDKIKIGIKKTQNFTLIPNMLKEFQINVPIKSYKLINLMIISNLRGWVIFKKVLIKT